MLVTQVAPALTDGIVLNPATGGAATGSSTATGSSANPFSSKWSNLQGRSSSLGKTGKTGTTGTKR